MFVNKVSQEKKSTKSLTLLTFFILTSFLVTILSISLVLAVEIEFTKGSSNFSQGETLIAKISGNFLQDVTPDNVFFYRTHVRIPMVYELKEVNGDFYVYALLTGKTEGDYSIALEGISYMSGIQESQEDVTKNFIINQSDSEASGSFSLNIQNLKPSQITVILDPSQGISSTSSTTLQSGEIKEITFLLDNNNPLSSEVKLSSFNTTYNVPVFITSNMTGTTGNTTSNGTEGSTGSSGGDSTTEDEEESFRFEPSLLNISMSTNSETKRIIYIVNTGNLEVKKINLNIPDELEPYVTITYPKSLEIDAEERVEITIESGNVSALIREEILAEAEGSKSSFNMTLHFIPDYIPSGDEGELVLTTCAQLGGSICTSDEKCAGEVEKVKDGICCLKPAICEPTTSGSRTKKIIGWSLVGVVLLFLLWFFRRYRRVRPQINMFGRR